MNKVEELLFKYWGYKKFKDQQKEIINSILSKRNTLATLPTGGGKSLCYQLPSQILGGVTLVISPLIALMQDQVRALNKIGISSFYFKSETKNLTIDQQLDNCIFGNYSIVYCSPERLKNVKFLKKIIKADINHIAIDEAHCISEWGHEFRPSYRNIKDLIKLTPKAIISVFTGSATRIVKNDIIENLGLTNFNILESSYERKNIYYEIIYLEDKLNGLITLLNNQSSIVYVNTRRSSELIAQKLSVEGFLSDYFHGGMSIEEKKEKLIKWHTEEIKVIVATTAFGMGIDKLNVRKIIHYNLPKSIEEFYQQSGRAGRDGRSSKAVLLVSPQDKSLFIKNNLKSLPNKNDLITTYKKLCTHLQIAIGEGHGLDFDFDFDFFCKKYDFNKNTAFSVLRFLERNELVYINNLQKEIIKIHIHSNIDSLKDSIKQSTKQSRVLESLLRLYPRITYKMTEISIEKLNHSSKLNKTEIKKYLNFYRNLNLLDIEIINCDIQLKWLKPREDNYTINPLIKQLENINNIKKNKFKQILNFIYDNQNCKTRQILEYFGENKNMNCMNCSSFSCK